MEHAEATWKGVAEVVAVEHSFEDFFELEQERLLRLLWTFNDGCGLGLYNPADTHAMSVGHTGQSFGYVSWAGCLLDEGAVIVVLSDVEFEDIGGMAIPPVEAVTED